MADRHRLAYRASARAIAACVTWTLCTGAISLPPPPQVNRNIPNQTATQGPNASQQNLAPQLSPLVQADIERIAKALESANAERNSPQERRRAEENLETQREIAFWGKVIAGIAAFQAAVTLLGVVLVGFALAATRRAANAAEKLSRE